MQITSKGFVTVPGVGRLRTKEGAEFNLGGNKREPVMGDSGVAGFTEEVVPATLKCTVLHTADTNLERLNEVRDVTITLETDTDVTYSFTEAFLVNPVDVKTRGGEFQCEFNAVKGQEV